MWTACRRHTHAHNDTAAAAAGRRLCCRKVPKQKIMTLRSEVGRDSRAAVGLLLVAFVVLHVQGHLTDLTVETSFMPVLEKKHNIGLFQVVTKIIWSFVSPSFGVRHQNSPAVVLSLVWLQGFVFWWILPPRTFRFFQYNTNALWAAGRPQLTRCQRNWVIIFFAGFANTSVKQGLLLWKATAHIMSSAYMLLCHLMPHRTDCERMRLLKINS